MILSKGVHGKNLDVFILIRHVLQNNEFQITILEIVSPNDHIYD